ncbi:D-sedoheptulose 7-phosphate isomerase [Candidatus Woesearchaeota archaeon]|nr:D-sedoheptulose 7-phosphate isomerase [Candidatus Woesearchaeota archaeon]
MIKDEIIKKFMESSVLINKSGEQFADQIINISKILVNAYKKGNKVLVAGNGGSAADAQHISAELVNQFCKDRKALSAIALTTDTSVLTSWSNDKSYDSVFERQIEAHGKPGDIFIPISTSGNSKNLICAVQKAKQLGLISIALLGRDGGEMKGLSDYEIIIPHNETSRIQEVHRVIYHVICELVEKEF